MATDYFERCFEQAITIAAGRVANSNSTAAGDALVAIILDSYNAVTAARERAVKQP